MILNSKVLLASAFLAGYYPAVWALPFSSHTGVERPSTEYRGDTIGGKVDPLSRSLERRSNPKPVNTHKEKNPSLVNVKATPRKQGPPKRVPKVAATPNRGKTPPSPPSHVPINRKASAQKSPAKRPSPQTPKGKPYQPNGKLPKKQIQVVRKPPAPSMKIAKGCLERKDCTTAQMLQLLQNPVKPGPNIPQRKVGNKSPIYAMNLGAMKFQEPVGDEDYEDEQWQ